MTADPVSSRAELSEAARDRLTMWTTENYKHDRARFPFGVYANPPALRADILALLAESEEDKARIAGYVESLDRLEANQRTHLAALKGERGITDRLAARVALLEAALRAEIAKRHYYAELDTLVVAALAAAGTPQDREGHSETVSEAVAPPDAAADTREQDAWAAVCERFRKSWEPVADATEPCDPKTCAEDLCAKYGCMQKWNETTAAPLPEPEEET